MDNKIENMKSFLSLIALVVVISNSCFSQTDSVDNRLFSERQKLKNYAFCKCLIQSAPKLDSFFIRDGSTAGFFETGAYNLEAYSVIDNFSKKIAQKIYKSKYNRPLIIMKCLDFYNSKELDDVVKSLDKEIDKVKLDATGYNSGLK